MSFEDGRLTLAYRDLDELPKDVVNQYKEQVEILDVSYNKIVNVRFLQWFPNLSSAICDGNLISGSTVFPPASKLKILWLNNNKIQCLFPLLENLANNFPQLSQLSLMGNPVVPPSNEESYYDYLRYRYYVISWLPNLEFLDDHIVVDFEREEAASLYKRPLLDSMPRLSQFLDSSLDTIRGLFTTDPSPPARAHFI